MELPTEAAAEAVSKGPKLLRAWRLGTYQKAREDFPTFRRVMHPDIIWDWWLEELAGHFQCFYEDLKAGKRPKMVVQAPPQHGKSYTVTDFIAWVAGKDPDLETIFASYSEDLGARTNRDIERLIRSDRYAAIFPWTRVGQPGWHCNTTLIEYVDRKGSFRNTTCPDGKINGMQLNLGIVDDPLKGRAEANQKTTRDKIWTWFTDDFCSRFHADAGMLIIQTRWHTDDLVGRYIAKFKGEGLKVLCYPAIAEEDEEHVFKDKVVRRRKGQALFPAWKPPDFLRERRALLTQASWASLYQQHPIIVDGGELPTDKMKILQVWERSKVVATARYWDKGATDSGAFTAGCLMHKLDDGRFVLEDMVRGRWSVLDREMRIKTLAESDSKICKNYQVWIEEEPGSSGRESAESTIRSLAGYRVYADKVTGSKRVRAEPFAAQVQNGNVSLVEGSWVLDFLDECECWPGGKYKDQVDAAAGAFNRLASFASYNTNYKEWAY
jgi:predicted phage terminase large subunit-like protein